jgi:2-oxoisovalerate dehydrogenase E1 component alpha subunit
LLEAKVSRLHGHSSSSGAQRVRGEVDCLERFEQKLLEAGVLDLEALERIHTDAKAEANEAVAQAMRESRPTPADVERHTYAPSPVDVVYPKDYTGLPN